MAVYTLPIEEKVKISLQPTCICLEGGKHQISWEESSSSCDRTLPDWSLKNEAHQIYAKPNFLLKIEDMVLEEKLH